MGKYSLIKSIIILVLLLVINIISVQNLIAQSSAINTDTVFNTAILKYKAMISNFSEYDKYPRSADEDGNLKMVDSGDWTSGFFPGILWYMYEYSKDEYWKDIAVKFTSALEDQKLTTGTHDIGFILYCSFGNGYRLTDSTAYADILLEGSNSLLTRFNENVSSIRSWDWGSWEFPVIIDNMMNLEMLYWAGKYSNDNEIIDKANRHALTTLKNHFREDNSSYHVVDYDTITGSVISKGTHQGYSDESAWTRGQTWGLYGFTYCYRETLNSEFLVQAKKIADFFISNLPSDTIPCWDFSRQGITGEPKDASAAAIAASALLELYHITDSTYYLENAEKLLLKLCTDDYLSYEVNTNGNFLLKHSTGNKPSNSEIDVPINYADYYFLEALLRYKKWGKEINCEEVSTIDTTVYYVADSSFEAVSPTYYLESIDTLLTSIGSCDSLLKHYSMYVYQPKYFTDTVYVNDTTYITVYDSIAVTDTLIIDVTITSLTPPENISTIKVYPNPAKDYVYIDCDDFYSQMNDYRIKIISSSGSVVFESYITQQLFKIDINNFGQTGLYFIQIIDDSNKIIEVKKILLE